MRKSLVLLAMVVSSNSAGMPRAAEGPCAPPRCVEHAMTIDRYTFRFNVLLPPRYGEEQRRYPVLYLFMGGAGGDAQGHNRNGWLLGSDLVGFTSSLPDSDQAIVVLPDHGVAMDSLDGTMKWETFQVGALIPFIDEHYRTIPDRAHRATAGLSQGGFAAMHHASRNPDFYVAAGSFSGAPIHLSDPVWVAVSEAVAIGAYAACPVYGGADDGWFCGGYNPQPGGPVGMLGPHATHEVWWRANDPTELAGNLGDVSVYVGSGNGIPCDEEDAETLAVGGSTADGSLVYYKIEAGAMPQASAFTAALRRAGVAHRTDLRPCGLHSWRYFWGDLLAFWPQMTKAFGSPAPRSFDFAAADSRFSVYGWTFQTEESRAPEFLTIADASCQGFGLTGSGVATVTTAPCFGPGETIQVGGSEVTADLQGRITLTVDLDEAHTLQQFTPEQRALEAAAGYWTSRTVTFEQS